MCESFKVTPKYVHRHFLILIFVLTFINGLPHGNQTDLMLNATGQDLDAQNGNTSMLLSRHNVTKELNHLHGSISDSPVDGAANSSTTRDEVTNDNRSNVIFTNSSNELLEYFRLTSNVNSRNTTSETLTTIIETINPSTAPESNTVLSNNSTLHVATVAPITSTDNVITSAAATTTKVTSPITTSTLPTITSTSPTTTSTATSTLPTITSTSPTTTSTSPTATSTSPTATSTSPTTTTSATIATTSATIATTSTKSISTIKPARSRPGRPSLVQRLMLNSRPYQPGDKPLYSEPLTTPETDYDDFVPAFDLGEIPKLTTTTQMSMPSFYDATPPPWLLEQLSASTTTGSPRKVFEITVPLLDGVNSDSTGDGESGQLVDSTSESSHGGIIPVQATTAIIISAIIGGCAIVFFSVVMALCIWRQHKSRRPIYPPNRPMIPTTSMTSINSQKSVGLFQR